MPRKKDKTPGFKSEADEAVWWDENDFLDYPDEFREVDIQIRRPPKITLSIRLPNEQINLLKRFGRRRNLGHTQLAAMWLAERIAIEKRRSEEGRKASSG